MKITSWIGVVVAAVMLALALLALTAGLVQLAHALGIPV